MTAPPGADDLRDAAGASGMTGREAKRRARKLRTRTRQAAHA